MKFLLTAICLVAGVSLATCYSSDWGRRSNADYLLLREEVIRFPKSKGSWSVKVDYPRWGSSKRATITGVYVIDHIDDGLGAYNTLQSGGPGYRHVAINLRSQKCRGINSTVEIWGTFEQKPF